MLAILKRRPLCADTAVMFSPRQRPLLLVADRLLGLRLSINKPVVGTAELPAGPARAAILVHSEGGRRRFAVAVRSLRNGASVVYQLEGEDLNESTGWAVALDAALSFGESMGFLFDDELLAERNSETVRVALARVRELIAPPGPAEQEFADEGPEILLDDALDAEAKPAPAAPELPKQARGSKQAPAERRPAAVLSKFRGAAKEAAKPTPDAAGRGAARLGRVRPVRLRSADTQPPVGARLRLLAAF